MQRQTSSRSVFVIVIFAALNACTAYNEETPRTVEPKAEAVVAAPAADEFADSHPITDEERSEVTMDPGLAEAMAVLKDERELVDLGRGTTFVDEDNPNTIEIRFLATSADGLASRVYAELVYQRVEGNKPRFYFVGLDAGAGAASAVTASSGCGPWSDWITTSTLCGYRWLCGRRNDREGIFKDQYRSRYCTTPGAYEFRTRLKFDHCGC